MFSVQRSDLGALRCSFQRSHGNNKLQYQRGTDRWTGLFPELGSEGRSLSGPDLFFVKCSDLGALQGSFQSSHGDTKLQSQQGTDRETDRGTALRPEVVSDIIALD